MLFGINLGGGNLPHESRAGALEGRLEKSRLAKRYGFHSLWSGAGYLNNDFHPMLLLSRVAAEAPGLELGMVALLPLYHPVEAAEQIATLDVISGGKFVLAPAWVGEIFSSTPSESPRASVSPDSGRCGRSCSSSGPRAGLPTTVSISRWKTCPAAEPRCRSPTPECTWRPTRTAAWFGRPDRPMAGWSVPG